MPRGCDRSAAWGIAPGVHQPLTSSAVGQALPASRAAVSRVAVCGHSPQALDAASTVLRSNGQQRTTAVGWNREIDGRERGLWAAVVPIDDRDQCTPRSGNRARRRPCAAGIEHERTLCGRDSGGQLAAGQLRIMPVRYVPVPAPAPSSLLASSAASTDSADDDSDRDAELGCILAGCVASCTSLSFRIDTRV
jgi:hypothetical protein